MSVSDNEAADALAAIQDARIRANGMKRLPFAYHVAVGALMGGWVAAQGLPRGWFGISLLAFLGMTWLMYRWQLQATSRWVNGFRSGRTLWVALAMAILFLALIVTSNPAMLPHRALFTPVQGGLIAFVALTFLDWLWVRTYDSEIRKGK